MHAEELGADAIFGYDHFHKPFVDIVDGNSLLHDEQPDVNNFKGWTALASWGEITTRAFVDEGVTLFTTEIHPDSNGYDFSELETMLGWRGR